MTGSGDVSSPRIVFLLDVDNTLLDNDRLKSDLRSEIVTVLGPERAGQFWVTYEAVRLEHDFVDYPQTVRRESAKLTDPSLRVALEQVIYGVDFRRYLYPGVFEVIEHLWSLGTVVILSDGDPVYQPRKIRESGLQRAVRNNVLVYVHKEQELQSLFRQYPADHYVLVDDKPRIISAFEQECASTFTTVLVLQGRYAQDRESFRPPDVVVDRIGDLSRLGVEQFLQQQPS